jgi:hypothetical protein
VLQSPEPLSAALVPHVLPLLAWDTVAHDAVTALRRVAEEHVGQLTDALIETDALLLGLEDVRFEVRYECARSLAAVIDKNPRVVVNAAKVLAAVQGEVAVARRVWEGHRLLNDRDVQEGDLFVDEVVKDRADRSLAHVFTLLSLILPTEPLQIAFRGLHTDDQNLRGTALEYLESVLPPQIRERLWPFLEDTRPVKRSTRQREDILADLLRSNESIALNLAELQRRARSAPPRPEPARG